MKTYYEVTVFFYGLINHIFKSIKSNQNSGYFIVTITNQKSCIIKIFCISQRGKFFYSIYYILYYHRHYFFSKIKYYIFVVMHRLRKLLFPFSIIYSLVLSIRNVFYDTNIFSSKSYKLPLICVGNLSVGGTGKTPMTEYLITLLKDNFKVAVLSRG